MGKRKPIKKKSHLSKKCKSQKNRRMREKKERESTLSNTGTTDISR